MIIGVVGALAQNEDDFWLKPFFCLIIPLALANGNENVFLIISKAEVVKLIGLDLVQLAELLLNK